MTPKEILQKHANEHSYDSWYELMNDTHEECQLDYTIDAMEEFAKMAFNAGKEMWETYSEILEDKYDTFDEWYKNVKNVKNDKK